MESKYENFYKKVVLVFSLVCILFLCLYIFRNHITPEWKRHQLAFKKLLIEKAKTEKEKGFANNYEIGLKQVYLPELGRVDRCVTCHNGMDNPDMKDAPRPHAQHSGNLLKFHPTDKFGCSVCHDGQGNSITKRKAFARDKDVHWERPVLPLKLTQASCGRCHSSVFDTTKTLSGADVFLRGRQLFLENGCVSCHNVRGLGGNVGPELTDEGAKTAHEYDFTYVHGKKTVQNWLKSHFKNPQQVSENSLMPAVELDDHELDTLTTFVLGLRKPMVSSDFMDVDYFSEYKGKRPEIKEKQAFDLLCATCHGENGEGKDYRIFEEATPALNNTEFLAMASHGMIKKTIEGGRSGRLMPPWAFDKGGLTEREIESLISFMRKWQNAPPSIQEVKGLAGDKDLGKTLFRGSCGICHGPQGEGAIGTALNNQGFLPLVTKEFLYETVAKGRENTAMPSWPQYTEHELASIIAYLKSWQRKSQRALSDEKITGDLENGKTLYAGICSQCHGVNGEGSVGPALFNKDLLKTASDDFLLKTASEGRENTAMISWSRNMQGMAQLSQKELHDVISFIRTQESVDKDTIFNNVIAGTVSSGAVMFAGMCAACHGFNGEGRHGPALNNQEFLSASTNGFMQATIAFGRSNTAMRSWAKGSQGYVELSEVDINDIISFIRNWERK